MTDEQIDAVFYAVPCPSGKTEDFHRRFARAILAQSQDALDARRYRWLRDDADCGDHTIELMRMSASGAKLLGGVADYDATIDAAMSKPAKEAE